jgi:hypothetical protein
MGDSEAGIEAGKTSAGFQCRTVVGPAVVTIHGEEPFAVTQIVLLGDEASGMLLCFDAVRTEPVVVRVGWQTDDDWTGVFEGRPIASWSIATGQRELTVRPLEPADASWLSDMPMEALPVPMLAALVRTIRILEVQDREPFNLEDCEPVEYVVAFVSIESGLVFGLGYWFGFSDILDESKEVFWRQDGAWQEAVPSNSPRWSALAPGPELSLSSQGETWRVRSIHRGMVEMFIAVFDDGGPISSTAALIANVDLETRDMGASDLPVGMADLMLEMHRVKGGHPDDVLIRFCMGTAFVGADTVLSMVLEFDRFRFGDDETRLPSGAWVPVIETSPQPRWPGTNRANFPGPFDLRGSELFRAFTSRSGYPAYHFASVFATSDDALYVGLDAVYRGADLQNQCVASLRGRMSPTSPIEWVQMWLDAYPEITISKVLAPPPRSVEEAIAREHALMATGRERPLAPLPPMEPAPAAVSGPGAAEMIDELDNMMDELGERGAIRAMLESAGVIHLNPHLHAWLDGGPPPSDDSDGIIWG